MVKTETPRVGSRPRSGGIFPALACILAVFTLFAVLSDLSADRALQRALKKTGKDLEEREEVLFFLSQTLQEGFLTLAGEEGGVSYAAALPDKASLSLSGEGYTLALFAHGGDLTLKSDALLPQILSGKRGGAGGKLEDSALTVPDFPEEALSLFRAFLALTDPELNEGTKTLSGSAKKIWKALSPRPAREKTTLTEGEEEIRVTKITYRFRQEALKDGLAAFRKEGEKEAVREGALALLTALSSLQGKALTPAEREACLAFLSGEGAAFAAINDALEDPESQVEISFFLRSGRVIGGETSFSMGAFSGSGAAFLGKNVKKSTASSLRFSLQKAGGDGLSLSLSHNIQEDSKTAYIAETSYRLYDTGILSQEENDAREGKIRYSWGKVKGDLGLRLILTEKEINFRGMLQEYKKGKELSFTVSGIEVDRQNRIASPITIRLLKEGEREVPPAGQAPLFPEGEEKERLREEISRRCRALFGEETEEAGEEVL